MTRTHTRLIAGVMTGTSLDAMDAALVEVRGQGKEMRARFVGAVAVELGQLRETLLGLTTGAHRAVEFSLAARGLGELCAKAVVELCGKHLPADGTLEMVVAHGQTLWHAPEQGVSWQLFDPWPVVRTLRVPVLYDLRQADLIAGGQGAPITPMADWVLYRDALQARLVVNLGGICNVTDLPADAPPEAISGGDIGPCNLLIDGLVRRLFPGMKYDEDGRIAARGQARAEFFQWVCASDFFTRKRPRTTGREDFGDAFIDGLVGRVSGLGSGASGGKWRPEDVIASAVDAVAAIIAEHARSRLSAAGVPGAGGRHLILAGGGTRNAELVRRIKAKVGAADRVSLSDELGIPASAREAAAFAVLGALSQDGLPITLEKITGAKNPGRAGVWARP